MKKTKNYDWNIVFHCAEDLKIDALWLACTFRILCVACFIEVVVVVVAQLLAPHAICQLMSAWATLSA